MAKIQDHNRRWYNVITSNAGVQIEAAPPDLSVVTFRYRPMRGDANEFNQKLIQAIQHDGRIFLSSTQLNGEVILRLTVLGFRTHLETIELALDILRQKAREIEGGVMKERKTL